MGFNPVPKKLRERPLVKEWNSKHLRRNQRKTIMRPLKFTQHVSYLISFVRKEEITTCWGIPVSSTGRGTFHALSHGRIGREAGQCLYTCLNHHDAEGQGVEWCGCSSSPFSSLHCASFQELLTLTHPFLNSFLILEPNEKKKKYQFSESKNGAYVSQLCFVSTWLELA